MNEGEIIEKIVKASDKTEEEIKALAKVKTDQLGDMITMEGALTIVAKELNVVLADDTEIEIEDSGTTVGGDGVQDLELDDLGKKYIKTPKVGEEVEFILKKIQKSKDIKAVTREGKAFSTALPSVDYKIVYLTNNDEEFAPKVWEVVGKINAICKKLKKIEDIELYVKHIKDGMKDKEGDNYEVKAKIENEWKVLDRATNDWK